MFRYNRTETQMEPKGSFGVRRAELCFLSKDASEASIRGLAALAKTFIQHSKVKNLPLYYVGEKYLEVWNGTDNFSVNWKLYFRVLQNAPKYSM